MQGGCDCFEGRNYLREVGLMKDKPRFLNISIAMLLIKFRIPKYVKAVMYALESIKKRASMAPVHKSMVCCQIHPH